MLTARVIDAADHPATDELRSASYARATWFTLKDAECIRCARDAPRSSVTAVFDGTTPLATVCQTVVLDADEARAELELDWDFAADDFPALVVSRAATAAEHSGRRLNHVLRWYMLNAAASGGIRSILAGQAAGTPNMRVVAELGYRLMVVERSTMSKVQIHTQHVLSYLPAASLGQALHRLALLLGDRLAEVAWHGPRLSFAPWLQPARQAD